MANKIKKNRMITIIIMRLESIIEGNVEEVIARLQTHIKDCSSKYTNLRFVMEPKEWDDGYELCLTGEHLETDKECKIREKKEQEMIDRHEKLQREQYEALKKKFGE